MQVLYCEACSLYHGGATVKARIGITVYAKLIPSGGWKADDIDYDLEWIRRMDLSDVCEASAKCPECDGPLEIKEVDTCPHSWRESYPANERYCTICCKRQTGEIVWEG